MSELATTADSADSAGGANTGDSAGGANTGDSDIETRPGAVPRHRAAGDPLLAVDDLFVSFTKGHNTVQAVAGISFTLNEGETLGLVGESGCGKSTTGRAIVQVEKPTSGKITFDGVEVTTLNQRLVTKKNGKVRRMAELYPDIRVTLLYQRDTLALLAKYGLAGEGSGRGDVARSA